MAPLIDAIAFSSSAGLCGRLAGSFCKSISSRTTKGCGASLSCSNGKAHVDADASLHREHPEKAPFLSASPKASRQASTDPSGCQSGVLRTVQGWRILGSQQNLQV